MSDSDPHIKTETPNPQSPPAQASRLVWFIAMVRSVISACSLWTAPEGGELRLVRIGSKTLTSQTLATVGQDSYCLPGKAGGLLSLGVFGEYRDYRGLRRRTQSTGNAWNGPFQRLSFALGSTAVPPPLETRRK